MIRGLVLACMVSLAVIGGCDIPSPLYCDHAMLRECFGNSPKQVEERFGKPEFIARTDSQLLPENATGEERKLFNAETGRMRYQYSTVDGDLGFHFNLNDKVYAITYAGCRVSPAP